VDRPHEDVMAEIRKVSLLYAIAEDRLALDTEDLAGGITRLWLTQRLCRALVTALVPMLQQVVTLKLPAGAETAAQSWEQAAAMADFGKTPGVQPGPDMTAGLVTAVHISPPGEQMTLTFDFGDGESRIVTLSVAALRQTLSVMHRLQAEAGWPLDIWPAWIADPAATAVSGGVN
jgi:hypothetical protein